MFQNKEQTKKVLDKGKLCILCEHGEILLKERTEYVSNFTFQQILYLL